MEGVITAMTTAFTTMVDNATDMVTGALPIVLGLVGLYFVVVKGVGFFKRIANKA